MRKLSTRADRHIAASSHDIWAYRLDFLHLPEYNPSVRQIELVSESGPDGTGALYRFDLIIEGGSHRVDLRVIRSVPAELVAIELGGALPAEEEFTVLPGAPDEDGAPGTANCVATITLTLLVPDAIPSSVDQQLLATGTEQIGDELDRMAELLEARNRTPSIS